MPADPQHNRELDLKNSRILLVDDDRLNLRILAGILKLEGYQIGEASSGEAALEIYESFKPDLVLMDVLMPGINGFETCRELKRRHPEDAAPVIFITAKSESDDIVEGLAAGGVDYLPKPIRPKEALARIRSHLSLRILLEEQKCLVDQLSKANTAKNRFLGMAAHDLRNPLASIRGMTEFLLDGTVGELSTDQKDLAQSIHEASQGMLVLVNELLDVATIEAGELKVHLEKKSLHEVVKKSVSLSNIESAKKGTRVLLDSNCRAMDLEIDAAKIRQVADNLISNAVKYSPPGSTVTVCLRDEGAQVSLSVQDQGPGIPANEYDKLFKDFSRLSVMPTGGEKSTGLGLAICRKIVEAHHGQIEAKNQPEGGCVFRVTLPTTRP